MDLELLMLSVEGAAKDESSLEGFEFDIFSSAWLKKPKIPPLLPFFASAYLTASLLMTLDLSSLVMEYAVGITMFVAPSNTVTQS